MCPFCKCKPCLCHVGVTYDEWEKLYSNFCTLGPTAKRVLLMLSERLAMGRRQYNDDFDKPRDWIAETLAEVGDQAIYAAVALIKAGESK